MFDKLIDVLLEFVGYFKFWRVIPINKRGVIIRMGKNPKEMNPGFHWILPFEIDHTETCVVKSTWMSSSAIHITTRDFKTISVAPTLKYSIIDPIAWFYGVNNAHAIMDDIIRFCSSDILTDCNWTECMTKPIWTKIKNKIKEKVKDLGIEIEDFGLIDLAISRVIITSINNG